MSAGGGRLPGEEDEPPIEPGVPGESQNNDNHSQHHNPQHEHYHLPHRQLVATSSRHQSPVPGEEGGEAFDPVSSSHAAFRLGADRKGAANFPIDDFAVASAASAGEAPRGSIDQHHRPHQPEVIADPGTSASQSPAPVLFAPQVGGSPPEVHISADIVPTEPSNQELGEEFVSSTTTPAASVSEPGPLLPFAPLSRLGGTSAGEVSTTSHDLVANSSTRSGVEQEQSVSSFPSTSNFQQIPSDPTKFPVDPTLLERVLDFGFEHYIATLAIQRTRGRGVEQAVNWIIDHSNQSDFEDEEEGGEEGGNEEANIAGESAMGLGSSTMSNAVRSVSRTHKMVFVANMELKMGSGKLAAQVGHATLGVYRVAQRSDMGQAALNSWRNYGEVKIVVKGHNTEQLLDLFKQAKDAGLHAYLVQDAGHTQVAPGSRTVLAVFGPQEAVDQITGALKLL